MGSIVRKHSPGVKDEIIDTGDSKPTALAALTAERMQVGVHPSPFFFDNFLICLNAFPCLYMTADAAATAKLFL
jgi:hypothetical protein